MNLGIAFQLVDDALDYAGREAELGKTVGDDFREGKITLPVILAFLRGGAVEREFWKRTIEKLDQREGDLAAGADPDRAPRCAGRHARARPSLRRHGARRAGPVPRHAAQGRAARGRRLRHRPGALDSARTRWPPSTSSPSTRARPAPAPSSSMPRAGRWRSAQKELPQIFPRPGWVEHDPEEIWSATVEVCRGALAKAKLDATALAGIGITNQRETTVVWDRATGKPIHNAIVWQDRRTADRCAELKTARPREDGRGQDRPAARSLFLGHQDRLDPEARRRRARRGRQGRARGRHDRMLPAVAPDRRQGACERRHQRQPHAAARHPQGRLGSRADEAAGRAGVDAADGRRLLGRARRHHGRLPGRPGADPRHGRRPAGGDRGPGLHQARHGQGDLRHRLLRDPQHRQHRGAFAATACSRPSPTSSTAGAPMRSKAASSSPAPPCNGCATACSLIEKSSEVEALAAKARGRPRRLHGAGLRRPGRAATGIPMRAARCSA